MMEFHTFGFSIKQTELICLLERTVPASMFEMLKHEKLIKLISERTGKSLILEKNILGSSDTADPDQNPMVRFLHRIDPPEAEGNTSIFVSVRFLLDNTTK